MIIILNLLTGELHLKYPTPCKKDDVNVIDTSNASKMEMPFEWEVTLENGLWWIVDKQIREHEFVIPEYVTVNPENIILLEE